MKYVFSQIICDSDHFIDHNYFKKLTRNPTNKHFYSYLNETYAEESSDNTMIELQPKSFKDVMKDVVVYVEVRSVSDNRTNGVKNVIANHGIKVNDRLLK